MKKFFAILLAIAMMATMSVTAFAATIEGNEGSVEVTYGVEDSYVVTIPASFTVGATEGTEVSASDVVIGYGEQLTVSISSTNYDTESSKWYLVDTANAENKLNYTIKVGDADVVNNGVILTVPAGTAETVSASLATALVDQATVSGTYKDTITFTVTVAEAPAAQE